MFCQKQLYVFLCLMLITNGLLSCLQKPEARSFSFLAHGHKREAGWIQVHDSLSYLYVTDGGRDTLSTWALPHPVYRFDYADIDGDGKTELLIGVIKATRFHPQPDKRLFIFKLYRDTYIRPLWLGSRVSCPLTDFRTGTSPDGLGTVIYTIEREQSGRYLIAAYRWQSFGLRFTGYLHRELSAKDARRLFRQTVL